jgi:hypothetical protein
MMTRKDYVATAEILKGFYDPTAQDNQNAVIIELVNDFSEMFKQDNERFDSKRFANAVLGDN